MKNQNNIDNYFDRVKQNPPLMDIEKVRQIINEAEVKVEVKRGRRNFLKFSLMTTMIAIIISAVMFWQGVQEEITNSKNQIPNSIVQTSGSMPIMKQEDNGTETTNISSDDKINSVVDLNKATLEIEDNNAMVANPQQIGDNNQPTGFEPAQPNGQKPIDFDTATFQPIDGSRFILNLSNEELEKIGFEFTDSSIIYEYFAFENLYKYGIVRKKCYNSEPEKPLDLVDENGRKYTNIYCPLITRNSNHYLPLNQQHDFYAIYISDTYISNVQTIDLNDSLPQTAGFEMENDTLLPILIPSLDENCGQTIFWFIFTDQLYNILAEKHKPILDEFKKYSLAKNIYPKKDVIIYQRPFKIDETQALKLSQIDLNKLGFKFFWDSAAYSGKYANYGHSINFSLSGQISSQTTDKNTDVNQNEGILAIFATTKNGSLLGNGLLPFFKANQFEWGNDFSLLIPVWVQLFDNLKRDAIFWFLPTEDFFNALPDSIGNDLRKEYNYIIAEDKSTLVKPECKYFEECKNTLKVSGFKVFPNPSNSLVTVSFTLPEAIDGRITLVDLAGRERQVLQPQTNYSKGLYQFDLDVSSVPEGIYLLTLYSDKGVQTQRLMVVR